MQQPHHKPIKPKQPKNNNKTTLKVQENNLKSETPTTNYLTS